MEIVPEMMNRTLLSLIEEISVKHNSCRPQQDCIEDGSVSPKLFRSIIKIKFNNEVLIGEAQSIKKKSSQHLAAGRLLLKVLKSDDSLKYFPSVTSIEEASKMINKEMAKYDKDNPSGKNSVVELHTYCKKCALADPIFEEIPASNNTFAMKCRVADKFESTGEGQSKKAAKANAAEEMYKLLENIVTEVDRKNNLKPEKDESVMEHDNSTEDLESAASISFEDKEKLLVDLRKIALSTSPDRCSKAICHKYKQVFDKYYGRECVWVWKSHATNKMTVVLESLHAVDMKKYNKTLDNSMILNSFFGSGADEKTAKNECARHGIVYLINWIERTKPSSNVKN